MCLKLVTNTNFDGIDVTNIDLLILQNTNRLHPGPGQYETLAGFTGFLILGRLTVGHLAVNQAS